MPPFATIADGLCSMKGRTSQRLLPAQLDTLSRATCRCNPSAHSATSSEPPMADGRWPMALSAAALAKLQSK
jgi:hypothetical protein